MISDIVWTSGASEDYLKADPALASPEMIGATLELLRLFPEMGSGVGASVRIRRALIGRQRAFGRYYSVLGARLAVVALLDLRQDPVALERLLKTRGIKT